MNVSKKMIVFRAVLVLVAALLLWHPSPVGAFSQSGGGAGAGGNGMVGVSGKVVETMDSGGYTYALVEKGGVKTWVAMPMTKIAVGQEIACRPGMARNNFESTTLKRSFASIVFSSGLAVAGEADALPAKVPAPAKSVAPQAIKVGKAEGANAFTVGEIFEKKASLANKPVVVNARVVKVSRGILGKNWLHLQDGTGSPATNTNDLVVTTDALSEVGEVITIKGNLALDRDFGAGYRYGVIIEGAEVTAATK